MSLPLGKGVQRVSTGYKPRTHQAELHRRLKRFNVLAMHRRFGKSTFAVNEMIDQAVRNQQFNPQYAYLAPTFSQAKRIIWTMLKQYTDAIPGCVPNEAELRIDLFRPATKDRIRLMILGAENPTSLKGIYLDGAILDEFGAMAPDTFTEAIRPTLIDRKGWAIFCGTPVGQNHFYKMYEHARTTNDPEWYAALFRASETGIIPEDELQSLRAAMDESEYEQELEVSFIAGLVGAYWGRELAALERGGKFTEVPYDPAMPVHCFWDLGMDDVTAIWFAQNHFSQWRMIDYMQDPDTSIPEWLKRVKETGYLIGKHYLPHDIKVRELGTGKSRLETFKNLGARNTVVVPRVEDKLDSIAAARLMLPKCVFDAKKCAIGIDALKNYQRRWDSKQNAFSPKPLHNSASNGADAYQTFSMGAQEDRGDDNKERQRDYGTEEQDFFTHSRRSS